MQRIEELRNQQEPVKPVEINSSGKPPLLQAGGIKWGGGVTRAWRQSHLMEVRNPVGLSSWLEWWRGQSHRERGGLTRQGEDCPGLFLLSSGLLPLLSTGGTQGKSRWRGDELCPGMQQEGEEQIRANTVQSSTAWFPLCTKEPSWSSHIRPRIVFSR